MARTEKEEAEQTLQQVQAQLEESNIRQEKLHCELLRQQEHSKQGETVLTSPTACFKEALNRLVLHT